MVGSLFPWLIIFGLINILLKIFPGWLQPFSNTFGYGIAKIAGLSKVTKQLFKEKVDAGDPEMKKVQSLLSNIYGDQSLLINEITPQNFGDFWKRLTPLFNNEAKNGSELKDKLFTLVRLKTLVSEYMWYMLTGALVNRSPHTDIL